MADAPDDHGGSRLIVDVASVRRRYGRLAAVYDRGHVPPDRALQLAAYAARPRPRLDTATALEESRPRRPAPAPCSTWPRASPASATPDDVADRLATAVPAVVDCDTAVVAIWTDESARWRSPACTGLSPDGRHCSAATVDSSGQTRRPSARCSTAPCLRFVDVGPPTSSCRSVVGDRRDRGRVSSRSSPTVSSSAW